jgi:hypothetical protein
MGLYIPTRLHLVSDDFRVPRTIDYLWRARILVPVQRSRCLSVSSRRSFRALVLSRRVHASRLHDRVRRRGQSTGAETPGTRFPARVDSPKPYLFAWWIALLSIVLSFLGLLAAGVGFLFTTTLFFGIQAVLLAVLLWRATRARA